MWNFQRPCVFTTKGLRRVLKERKGIIRVKIMRRILVRISKPARVWNRDPFSGNEQCEMFRSPSLPYAPMSTNKNLYLANKYNSTNSHKYNSVELIVNIIFGSYTEKGKGKHNLVVNLKYCATFETNRHVADTEWLCACSLWNPQNLETAKSF